MPKPGDEAEAKRRVVGAQRRVVEQTILVALLRLDGQDTQAAMKHLFILEAALAQSKACLDKVTKAEH